MANWKIAKVYGKKRWIVAVIVLVGSVLLAILLGTSSADESFNPFFSRVVHAAFCTSTITSRLQDNSTKIIFEYQFANRVFITLRSDNSFMLNISCLSQVLLTISFTVAVVGFLQLSVVALYVLKVYFRKPSPSGDTEVEILEESSGTSSRYLQDCIPYSYNDLVQATNNFTDEIGRGGYGVVYRGELVHEGRRRSVAIKKIPVNRKVDEVVEGEIRRIGMLRHKNVLQLLGYSDSSTSGDLSLLMVTPLHSSLAKHLEDSSLARLNWAARFKIAVGVAEGLAYLHDGVLQGALVHHDIKPGNILFDRDTFQAYIADFGSAKFLEPMQHEAKTSNIVGTSAYMDPHFRMHKIRTTKVDVYSFGVVLFVLVAGGSEVPDIHLVTETDIIDPGFISLPDASYNRDEVNRTLAIARLCTRYEPTHRPTMIQVVMMLRNDIPVFQFAQDLSRVASSVATFAQATISKVKYFNRRVLNSARQRWLPFSV